MNEDDMFESDHIPQLPHMPIAGSSHGYRVTLGVWSTDPHQCHQHPIWSLIWYPSTCLGSLTPKHQGRIQTVRQKGCQM